MNKIVTIDEKHAIAKVIFVIEFDQPILSEALKAIDAAYIPNWKKELPRRQVSHGFGSAMPFFPDILARLIPSGDVNVPGADAAGLSLTGLSYDRLRPDGQEDVAVKVQLNNINIVFTSYNGWAETWAQTRRILDWLLPVAANGRKFASIGVHYLDHFYFDGAIAEFSPDMVFRRESPFLAPHIFDRKLTWHSHTGLFTEVDRPIKYRRLDSIAVDMLEPDDPSVPTRTLAQITSAHVARLGFYPSGAALTDGDNLNAIINDLHGVNKRLLKSIINDQMCKKIGL